MLDVVTTLLAGVTLLVRILGLLVLATPGFGGYLLIGLAAIIALVTWANSLRATAGTPAPASASTPTPAPAPASATTPAATTAAAPAPTAAADLIPAAVPRQQAEPSRPEPTPTR